MEVEALDKETQCPICNQLIIFNVKSEDISCYIDLKDLDEGEHEVDVQVEGSDNKVTYISMTKKVKIKIVRK